MVPLDLVPETVAPGPPSGVAQHGVERRIRCEIRAGCRARRSSASRIRQQHPLRIVEWHHQVSSPLPYVSDLKGGVAGKLVLDSHVPFIRDRRLHLGVPNPEESLSVAGIRWRIARCRRALNPQSHLLYSSEAGKCCYKSR